MGMEVTSNIENNIRCPGLCDFFFIYLIFESPSICLKIVEFRLSGCCQSYDFSSCNPCFLSIEYSIYLEP